MNKEKVTIVGAGPGGLTAAITLAKAGYEPIVYEQNQSVGQRFNGDFQGLENWSDEEDTLRFLDKLGLKVNFLCHPYTGKDGYFFGPKLKKITVQTSRPLFYLVERGSNSHSLDQGLKAQAEEAGVKILWGEKLEAIPTGRAIVGTGPKAADAIAKGLIFKTSHEDVFIGYLDNKIAPKAYSYLLVNNGSATFATCMFDDFRNEKIYYERAFNVMRQTVDIDIRDEKEFGGFVNFFNEPVLAKDERILYIGENAGFQDALWGFGIKYAMLSGYLAAKSIIDGTSYEELCRKHIYPKLQTSLANRWLFAQLHNPGYNYLLNKMSKMEDVISPLRRHYNISFSKKITYRLAKRWYRSRLIDKQCMHEHCDCVWCRHGKHAHAST